MHARFYNPQVGRFLSTDPVDSAKLTVPQSWNYYAYAIGNPLRYTDPTGESPWDAVKGFGNAFASNLSLGLYARVESNNPDFQAGQRLGDQASLVAGLYEGQQGAATVVGAGVCAAGSAGGCAPAAVPAATVGVVAIVHGSAVAALAGQNLAIQMEGSGSGGGAGNVKVLDATQAKKMGLDPEGVKADLGLGREAKKFNLGVDGNGNLVLVPLVSGYKSNRVNWLRSEPASIKSGAAVSS